MFGRDSRHFVQNRSFVGSNTEPAVDPANADRHTS